MHKIIDGGKLELAQPGQAKLESRYDYYRRCQALRTNGPQCKAPAVKDQNICRKHAEQREKLQRAAEQRRAFAALIRGNGNSKDLSGISSDPMNLQRTVRDLMQAMIDGRLDEDTAGALLDEIALRQGLLKRF
jgi:hypothetical protein